MRLAMLRHRVAAGEGTSLVPALATRGLGDMGGAVAYTRIATPGIGRDVALVVRRSDPRETALRALAALFRNLSPEPVDGLGPPAGGRSGIGGHGVQGALNRSGMDPS